MNTETKEIPVTKVVHGIEVLNEKFIDAIYFSSDDKYGRDIYDWYNNTCSDCRKAEAKAIHAYEVSILGDMIKTITPDIATTFFQERYKTYYALNGDSNASSPYPVGDAEGDALEAIGFPRIIVTDSILKELATALLVNVPIDILKEYKIPKWNLLLYTFHDTLDFEQTPDFDLPIPKPKKKINWFEQIGKAFCSSDELKPSMTGIFHDATGVLTATDAHCLCSIPKSIHGIDNLESETIYQWKFDGTKLPHRTIDFRFPDFINVVPDVTSDTVAMVDLAALYTWAANIVELKKYASLEPSKHISTAELHIGDKVIGVNCDYVKKVAKFLLEINATECIMYIGSAERAIAVTAMLPGHSEAIFLLIMPVMLGVTY